MRGGTISVIAVVALVLLLQPQVSHSQASRCRYTNDGECDEPDLCPEGSDVADCSRHSSSSSRRRSSYPPPPPSRDEDGFDEFEDEEGSIGSYSGWELLFNLIVFFILLFFPCIVFGAAWCTCIRQHNTLGEKPNDTAWSVCGTLFALTLLSPFFLGLIFWLVLPFFMIIPFCCNNCYDLPPETRHQQPHGVTLTVNTTAPQVQMVQAQPVMAQAQPVMAQAVMAQAYPATMASANPVAAATVATATVANPYAGQQQQQPPLQQPLQLPPQQPPPPQYASAPVSFEVEAVSGARGGGVSLHQFLVDCELSRFEMAMQEMGALEAADLRDITEEELVAMGMKKLEARRLQRSLTQLG